MKKLTLLLLVFALAGSHFVSAQSLESNTQWLSHQLDKLVKEEKGKNLNVNGHESAPTFKFKGCQMNMNIDARDTDVNFGMTISWLLKDVQRISYIRENNGEYELRMIVPADRMKMRLGFGRDNAIGGSFNLKDEGDSKPNFTLHTKDESIVQEIVYKFEESVRLCKNTR